MEQSWELVKKRAKKKWDHETQTLDDFAAILYGEIREHIGRDYNVSVVNRRHVEVMNVRTANSFFWDVPWPTTLEIMEESIVRKSMEHIEKAVEQDKA